MAILLETLLTSEFYFGFELEANANINTIPLKAEYKNRTYHNDLENDNSIQRENIFDKDKLLSDLKKEFSKTFGNNIDIITDESLDKITGFEFPVPKMRFTPLNIKKCINFLANLPNSPHHIYTDERCGFHVHFSFPNISKEDAIWLTCNLALDNNMIKYFTSFNFNGNIIDFHNPKYANESYLNELKEAIINNNFQKISSILLDNNEKYRLLRIHPQGTLEWRSPRNFLNDNNINIITAFFVKLFKIIEWVAKTIDKKEINGITKNNFFNTLNSISDGISIEFGNKYKPIAEKIINNPLQLIKINSISLSDAPKLIDTIFNQLGNKKFQSFLINLRYKSFNPKILAAILIYEPLFFNFINEELPINELYKMMGAQFVGKIISIFKMKTNEIISLYKIFNGSIYDFLQILFYCVQNNYNPYNSKLLSFLAQQNHTNVEKFKLLYSEFIPY